MKFKKKRFAPEKKHNHKLDAVMWGASSAPQKPDESKDLLGGEGCQLKDENPMRGKNEPK